MGIGVRLPRLANGFEARVPYQVSLFDAQANAHICGGAILNSIFILTAYHCMYRSPRMFEDRSKVMVLRDEKDIRVIAGSNSLQPWEHSVQVRTIESGLYYGDFDFGTLANDLVVFQLSRPLKFNQFVNYIPLPLYGREFKGNISISGWGSLGKYPNDIEEMPDASRSASLPIIDNTSCAKAHTGLMDNVTFSMLCAQGSNVTICPGDSGSPGVCFGEGSMEPVLCGIASWAGPVSDCFLENNGSLSSSPRPAVFTKVSSFTKWISLNIRAANVSEDYWMCDNLQFIRREERCNNEKECEDESDEFNCDWRTRIDPQTEDSETDDGSSTITPSSFRTSSQSFNFTQPNVPISCDRWSCAWDYKYNLTQRDKFDITFKKCQLRTGFLCPTTEVCIDRFKLCDGVWDCPGGIDENYWDCLGQT